MKKPFFIIIYLVGFLYCCSYNNEPNAVTESEEEPVENEIVLEDTLRLFEGTIPEEWFKVSLQDGYYIGFPKEPRKKESRSNRRVDYKLKRNKYRLYISLTDLAEEPSFQENQKYRSAYYEAIVNDLAEEIEGDVFYLEPFYSQDVYEGLRATVSAEDTKVYMQCIIIESVLYTASLVLFDEEKPVYLQLRDKFFYSFGNDLYKTKTEQKLLDTVPY